jgi:uncharacterized damage-inducible protein DinB
MLMDSRYPIGDFKMEKEVNAAKRQQAIAEIAAAPEKLRAAVAGLNDGQLETPYREGGWTVRQLVHHVADSHVNAYIRYRLAMTEIGPTIKPYEEKDWAELADAKSMPVTVSLDLLDAMHARWVKLMQATPEKDFARTLTHPEHGPRTADWLVFLYAWHGRHHTAHVTELRKAKGW